MKKMTEMGVTETEVSRMLLKMDLRDIEYGRVDWIQLAQNGLNWWAEKHDSDEPSGSIILWMI